MKQQLFKTLSTFFILSLFIILALASEDNSSSNRNDLDNSIDQVNVEEDEMVIDEYNDESEIDLEEVEDIVVDNYFVFEKEDAFGYTKEVVYFNSDGDGEFFWEWTVSGSKREGSSEIAWSFKDNIIIVNYIYSSTNGGKTKETLKLEYDVENPDQLKEVYGSKTFNKTSGYEENSSSNSSYNNEDCLTSDSDVLQYLSGKSFRRNSTVISFNYSSASLSSGIQFEYVEFYRMSDNRGYIKLASLDPNYPDLVVKLDVYCEGKVVDRSSGDIYSVY